MEVPVELLTHHVLRPDGEIDIQTLWSVPGITSVEQLPGELRDLNFATDRSAEEGLKNGGGRVYIR